jgi:hypothetical protein
LYIKDRRQKVSLSCGWRWPLTSIYWLDSGCLEMYLHSHTHLHGVLRSLAQGECLNNHIVCTAILWASHCLSYTCIWQCQGYSNSIIVSSCLYRASTVWKHFFIIPNWCTQL